MFKRLLQDKVVVEEKILKITFGLITDGKNDDRLFQIINSIKSLEIEFFEILVVGNSAINLEGVRVISFAESPIGAWITKKKNLITALASYDIIVYSHDYFIFDKSWFKEFSKIDDFDVAMCAIKSPDDVRYRDWTLWPHNGNLMDLLVLGHRCLIPYSIDYLKEFMYISGSFWIADRKFMLMNPLDENLFAGQGEDVEWSIRIRNHARYLVSHKAIVYSLKENPRVMSDAGMMLKGILWLGKNRYVKELLKIKISPKFIVLCNFVYKRLYRIVRFRCFK